MADTISYDPVGRPVLINSGARTFSYDLADQLVGEASGGVSTQYSYDVNGNQATLDQGSLELTYSYDDAGQLTGIDDGSVFSYDDAGRRLTAAGPGYSTSFGYDNAGRLIDLARTEGQTTTYESRSYAPFGTLDRLSDTTGSATTSTRLDRDATTSPGQLLGVTTNTTNSDLIGIGEPDVTATGGTIAPVGFDVFDSVTSTPSGATLPGCATTYDAWGVPTTGAASSTKPCVGYRNQLGVNTLYYAHARNYTPTLGAFTTPDPAQGQPGTPTLTAAYPYANNNPITNTDPTGMYAVGDNAMWGLSRLPQGIAECGTNPAPQTGCDDFDDRNPQLESNLARLTHMAYEAAVQYVSRTYGSFGKCMNVNISGVAAFQGSGCFMTHDGFDVYNITTPAFGMSAVEASVGAGFAWSNTSAMTESKSPTACLGLSVGPNVAGSMNLCVGTTAIGPDLNHVSIDPYLTGSWTAEMAISVGRGNFVVPSLVFGESSTSFVFSCNESPAPSGPLGFAAEHLGLPGLIINYGASEVAPAACGAAVRFALGPPF